MDQGIDTAAVMGTHRTTIVVLVAMLVAGVGILSPARAQTEREAQLPERARIAFADGLKAVQQGHEEEAARLLTQVIEEAPTYRDREKGSAAYWLGRAYAANDQPDRAIGIWRVGLIALHEANHFEIHLADAFIRTVFRQKDEANYTLAANAYLRMMRSLDQARTPDEKQQLAQHLKAAALVLPDAVKRNVGLDGVPGEASVNLAAVKPEPLLAWWRREDPLPATRANERLEEHLQRVTHAYDHYAAPDRASGLDDRGEIYVRYGAPENKVSIDYNETRLTDEIFRPGISVNLSDFPMNEFWSYGNIDRSGYYLFVEGDNGYRVGTFEELIPRTLRRNFSSSARGQRRSYLALATMRAVYRELAPFHPDLALRHDEVANYMAEVSSVGLTSRGNLNRERSLNTQIRRPSAFAEKTVRENQNRDVIAANRREKFMPQQASEALEDMETMAIASRTARFLDENGSTRTEIYWAPEGGALGLSDDQREDLEEEGFERFNDFVIRMTATQKAEDYQERIVNQKHYRVNDLAGADATIPAQTLVTRGDTSMYHLAMQWDEHLVKQTSQGTAEIGPRTKIATFREDSLQALISDDRILEMSDLRVLTVPDGVPETQIAERGIPYPFRTLSPGTPLGLYFEVYHLAFGGNDNTQYTVEYEVERRTERGNLVKLFRGDEEQRTATRTTYEGRSRTAEEYILLNLSEWEGNGRIAITVRVTDEQTGQQVERAVSFQPPQ